MIQRVVIEVEEEKEVEIVKEKEKEIVVLENIVEVIVEIIEEVIKEMMIIEKDMINQKILEEITKNNILNFVVWKMVLIK